VILLIKLEEEVIKKGEQDLKAEIAAEEEVDTLISQGRKL